MICTGNKKRLCDNEKCKKCFDRSFASHPRSKFWSNENNVTARQVFLKSNKKYKFQCDKCNHIFEMMINNITHNNQWCPYCSNQKLCKKLDCDDCYNKSFASHPKVIYWSIINDIYPRFVFKKSNKKYYFDCDCNHTFDAALNNICADYWCPYCCNPPLKLCADNECQNCYNKSFASHPKSEYWSNNNDKTPRQVFKNSSIEYKFDCTCGHIFELRPGDINSKNYWCPFESGKKLCGVIDCIECFNKSFASHPKAKYWSVDNEELPINVFKSSNKFIKFDCDCCHQFEAQLFNINKGSWCPYCCNPPIKLCNDDNCQDCCDKSFASHPMSKYLIKANNINPRNIFLCSNLKYKFKCKKGHIFMMAPNNIICHNRWCPFCKKKTEAKIFKILIKADFTVVYQAKYDWCKNKKTGKYYYFDFVLEDYKIIIELDGAQHFRKISNWCDPKVIQKRDIYKMRKAVQNGYTVIRIMQEDVWNDNYDWFKKLKNKIRHYNAPRCIFLCENNEYKHFVEV